MITTAKHKTPSPALILVMGLPGSGKTYFARAFANRIGGEHFHSDIIRKQQRQEQHTGYSDANKSKVYLTMFEEACQALNQQKIVVVDATFSRQRYREPYIEFANTHGIIFKIILVTAEESTIRQRTEQPRPDSDADFQVYKKIKSEFEPIGMDHLELHSDRYPLEKMINKGVAYLSNQLS